MVSGRCLAVASLIVKFLAGRVAGFDVSQLVVATVEGVGGGFRCRLCGYTGRVNMLVYHLRRRHCGELVELWGKLRPRPLYSGGGGRASFMPFVFYCRVCGWGLRLELPCNAGPPSLKRKLGELLGVVIPRCCPSCGRVFDLSRIELGFVGERDFQLHVMDSGELIVLNLVPKTRLSTPCNGFTHLRMLGVPLEIVGLSTPCNGFGRQKIGGNQIKELSTPCNGFSM